MTITGLREGPIDHAWVRALRIGSLAPVPYRGAELLEHPLLNKDTAFTERERNLFGCMGSCPRA